MIPSVSSGFPSFLLHHICCMVRKRAAFILLAGMSVSEETTEDDLPSCCECHRYQGNAKEKNAVLQSPSPRPRSIVSTKISEQVVRCHAQDDRAFPDVAEKVLTSSYGCFSSLSDAEWSSWSFSRERKSPALSVERQKKKRLQSRRHSQFLQPM